MNSTAKRNYNLKTMPLPCNIHSPDLQPSPALEGSGWSLKWSFACWNSLMAQLTLMALKSSFVDRTSLHPSSSALTHSS